MTLFIILTIILLPYFICLWRAQPPGVHVQSKLYRLPPEHVQLLIDSTAYDPTAGVRVFDQTIFDRTLEMIHSAEQVVYVDFFLWNSWTGDVPESHRNLAAELAQALIKKKQQSPETHILVQSDPINRVYGQDEEKFYHDMVKAGIVIVFTDLKSLRDSNYLYSAPARIYGPVLNHIPGIHSWLNKRSVKNPLDSQGQLIPPLQFARLLYFKANHRKVVITDSPDGWQLLVTSFNPANGSSGHSNAGLALIGDIAFEALQTELDCAEWSARKTGHVLESEPGACAQLIESIRTLIPNTQNEVEGGIAAEWVTEEAIRNKAISMLDHCGPGDKVELAMFYLSDRKLIRAVKEAAYGGADIRIILDANRDAFGRIKNGIPNRPVAAELRDYATQEDCRISIRWADTHGEQFHTKILCIRNKKSGKAQILCGSANWTRRNLEDFNLEANIFLDTAPSITDEFATYFDLCWENGDGLGRTLPYETWAIDGFERWRKNLLYRIQESTGLSTF